MIGSLQWTVYCFFVYALSNTVFGFRGESMTTILESVNNDVSKNEGSSQPGKVKQMSEVRFTLRKKLVLSPHSE